MTSLKEAIARLVRSEKGGSGLPDPHFNYRVYWTKQAMQWTREHRERILEQTRALIHQPEFIPSEMERIYKLHDLDNENHAGASMLALEAVLSALEQDQE